MSATPMLLGATQPHWSRQPPKSLYHKLADALFEVVNHDEACWLWCGSRTTAGYGTVRYRGHACYTHRAVYEMCVGEIPAGMTLDHKCRQRACCNPRHLEPVSAAENCRRGVRAKLTHADAASIKASTESPRVIASRYGIDASTVFNIRAGRRWSDAV